MAHDLSDHGAFRAPEPVQDKQQEAHKGCQEPLPESLVYSSKSDDAKSVHGWVPEGTAVSAAEQQKVTPIHMVMSALSRPIHL